MNEDSDAGSASVWSYVFLVVLLLAGAAVIIPNFVKARLTRSFDSCLCYLMWVERAKQEWAKEKGKVQGAVPTEGELAPYLRKIPPIWNNRPQPAFAARILQGANTCPAGGIHAARAVGERPSCSLNPGRWDEAAYQEYY